VAGAIERCARGVERQIRYVTDPICVLAVVIARTIELIIATDTDDTLANVAKAVPPNLDQVLIAGDNGEGHLGLPFTEIVVGFDHVARCRVATVPFIDSDHGVEATVT